MNAAHPVMNWGRWIASCPDSACPNAEHYGPDPYANTAPHIGGLKDDRFDCSFCKRTFGVEWPQERTEIEVELQLRPVPSTRNWIPGEPVAHLTAENIEHGLVIV